MKPLPSGDSLCCAKRSGDLNEKAKLQLECSYPRPDSNLMFSTDQSETWTHHAVIIDLCRQRVRGTTIERTGWAEGQYTTQSGAFR